MGRPTVSIQFSHAQLEIQFRDSGCNTPSQVLNDTSEEIVENLFDFFSSPTCSAASCKSEKLPLLSIAMAADERLLQHRFIRKQS